MWPGYKFWFGREGTAPSTAVISQGTFPAQKFGSGECITESGQSRLPAGADETDSAALWQLQPDDDMGWLSLTSDADGHGVHEHDVLCMGVIPDDLDLHDAGGGDLGWMALIPADAEIGARRMPARQGFRSELGL